MKHLIDRLAAERNLNDEELLALITMEDGEADRYLALRAAAVRDRVYGKEVFIRGLIELPITAATTATTAASGGATAIAVATA